METIWGGFSAFLLILSIYWAVKGGRRAQKITLSAAIIIEVIVTFTMFMDWGYSWVEESGIHIAMEHNIWVLVPQLMALTVLVVLLGSKLRRAWLAFMLSILQVPVIFYSIYMVQMDLDLSMFTIAAVICLGGATTAAILLLPTVVRTMPDEGSHLWKLVFANRQGVLQGIRAAAQEMGLTYEPPATILESGSAKGDRPSGSWVIHSHPSLWPPGYGLTIDIDTTAADIQQKSDTGSVAGIGNNNHHTLDIGDNGLHYSCIIRTPGSVSRDDVVHLARDLERLTAPGIT